ncbi:unnamed protein product [Caenorhabditis angaria]|uniref:Serpentine Receptor, class H n=1 Tax=Caenorhabditis angaria TaxID=860376 RepID=A0A9P1IWG5_9PELO|nr:unnamed protein product [Caenorhabditis angaria]
MFCEENHTYYWSGDYLRNCYHITALFSVPMSVLLFYCIFYKTPKRMESMKPALINLQFWTTNLDFVLTIFSCPYIFFPSASGRPLGILSDYISVKWQSYYGQLSVMYIGVALIMLYENRQSQIMTITFKLSKKRTRIIYYAANYIALSIIVLPFYMTETNQSELIEMVLDRIPCPSVEFFDNSTYVLLRGDEKIPFFSITISTSLVVFQTLFFVLHSLYHLTMIKNHKVSKNTKEMQKKYLVCVTTQFSIPLLVIIFPICYSLYSDRFNYYNQAYNNNAMLMMATHGFFSSFSALYIYKHYRDFCLQLIFRKKNRRISVTTTNRMSLASITG